ncbi:HAD family hydrolase [Shinella sp. BYT-45]|uniref:HAD family hydrolase n=1 Tax=Shinella sp. BYT-45 TaxID=3377377 RepID=UPI003980702D
MTIDLVIFDCDGVLVDSEKPTSEAIASSLTRFGYPIRSEEVLTRYRGKTLFQIEASIRTCGAELPADWHRLCEDEMYERLRTGVATSKGVPDLLQFLSDAGVRVGIASNGAAAKMRITLGPSGLWDRLGTMILSGHDTGYPKPSPYMLESLMDRAQVAPERTMLIDDSGAGRQAADAAGCHFIGYFEHGETGSLRDRCTHVAHSMADVEEILRRLRSRDRGRP